MQKDADSCDHGWRRVTRGRPMTHRGSSNRPPAIETTAVGDAEGPEGDAEERLRGGKKERSDEPSASAVDDISAMTKALPSTGKIRRSRRTSRSDQDSDDLAGGPVLSHTASFEGSRGAEDPVAETMMTSLLNGSSTSNQNKPASEAAGGPKTRKLSASKMQELPSLPESLPLQRASSADMEASEAAEYVSELPAGVSQKLKGSSSADQSLLLRRRPEHRADVGPARLSATARHLSFQGSANSATRPVSPRPSARPTSSRTVSSPVAVKHSGTGEKQAEAAWAAKLKRGVPSPLQIDSASSHASTPRIAELRPTSPGQAASPMPPSIPLPPLSLPTYLQLELSSSRPSPLYIYHPSTTGFPYESSKVKFERLLNFLLLPPQLELTLWFGALACLDAWLYTFTILPLRFLIALSVLGRWWGSEFIREAKDLSSYVYFGLGRLWKRSRRKAQDVASALSVSPSRSRAPRPGKKAGAERPAALSRRSTSYVQNGAVSNLGSGNSDQKRHKTSSSYKHRRSRSSPSALMADHKADLLKGLVVIFSCLVLMRFDASRMYHGIRGQAAIKLYVIYNVLEACSDSVKTASGGASSNDCPLKVP
jgi:hypothetical protein